MKNFAAGARIGILLWASWVGAPAHGLDNRTAWLFEQLAQETIPTAKGRVRHEVGLSGTHLGDVLSLQATANVDLHYFEIRAKGSRRVFLQSDSSRLPFLEPLATTGAVEIARYFASESHHFGRMGLELVEFFPAKQGWLGLRFHMGILDTPKVPWAIGLQTSAHFLLEGAKTRILVGVDTRKLVSASGSQQWHVGGRFQWLHLTGNVGAGRTEHFQMGLGPYVEWLQPLGSLSLALTLRFWMDRETVGSESYFPSEFSPPNLSLAWRSRW